MQSSHHFQVETDQATSTRDVASSKKTSLLMAGVGLACFMLGVASVCLVLPSASHSDSLQKAARHDLAYAPMGMPVRANPQNARVSKRPSSFLPVTFPVSIATAALKQDVITPPANGAADFAKDFREHQREFREQHTEQLREWLHSKGLLHVADESAVEAKGDGLKAAVFAKSEEQRMAAVAAASAKLEKERLAVEAAAKAEQDKLKAAVAADWLLTVEAAVKAEENTLNAELAAKVKEGLEAAGWKLQIENYKLEVKAEKDRLEAEVAAKLKQVKAGKDRLEAEADRKLQIENYRLEVKAEKNRLEVEVAAKLEQVKAEKDRLEAKVAAQLDQQRLEAEAAIKAEKAKEAAAKLEQDRLEGEAALKAEKNKLTAEVAAKVGDASADTPTTNMVDYSANTVVQPRDVLRSRGLTLGGNKAELVARLQDEDSTPANAPASTPRQFNTLAWKQPHGYDPANRPGAKPSGDDDPNNRAPASASPTQDAADAVFLLPKPRVPLPSQPTKTASARKPPSTLPIPPGSVSWSASALKNGDKAIWF